MKTIAHEIFSTAGQYANVLGDVIAQHNVSGFDAAMGRAFKRPAGRLLMASCFQRIHTTPSGAYAYIDATIDGIGGGYGQAVAAICESAWDAQGIPFDPLVEDFIEGFGELAMRLIAIDYEETLDVLSTMVSTFWPAS